MVTSHLFSVTIIKLNFTGLGHWSEQPFEAMHKEMKVSYLFFIKYFNHYYIVVCYRRAGRLCVWRILPGRTTLAGSSTSSVHLMQSIWYDQPMLDCSYLCQLSVVFHIYIRNTYKNNKNKIYHWLGIGKYLN